MLRVINHIKLCVSWFYTTVPALSSWDNNRILSSTFLGKEIILDWKHISFLAWIPIKNIVNSSKRALHPYWLLKKRVFLPNCLFHEIPANDIQLDKGYTGPSALRYAAVLPVSRAFFWASLLWVPHRTDKWTLCETNTKWPLWSSRSRRTREEKDKHGYSTGYCNGVASEDAVTGDI